MNRLGKYRGVVSLAGLFVLAPGLVYLLALHGTVSAWRDCRQLQARTEWLRKDSLPQSGPDTGGGPLLQGAEPLLQRILPLAGRHGGVVEQYTPYVTRREGDFTLHTDELVVQGEYIGLLRLNDAVERELPACKIASLGYALSASRNPRQAPKLKLTLVIQYITNP